MDDTEVRRKLVVIGALLRRPFRTFLDLQRVEWSERKGLTTSDFIIDANAGEWRVIYSWIERVKEAVG